MSIFKIVLGLGGFVLFGAAFAPFEYLAAPTWHVLVVDSSGTPLSGVYVRRAHQNYSVEDEGHDTNAFSGGDGRVTLQSVKSQASGFRFLWFTLKSLRQGFHASFGRFAYVSAFSREMEGFQREGPWKGDLSEMNTTLRMRRRAVP